MAGSPTSKMLYQAAGVHMYSLKLKFIAILAGILLAVFLLQSFYFVPKLTDHENGEILETQQLMAQLLTESFAISFQQTVAEIEGIAGLPGIVSLKKEELDRILAEMNQATQFFNYYFILGLDGTVISYPSKPFMVGEKIKNEWVRDEASKRTTTFLDVHFAGNINKLVSGFVTPILSPGGEVTALIRGVISVSEDNALLEQIKKIKIGQNGFVYIVDSNGRLVAHPEIPITSENTELYDYTAFPPVSRALRGETGVTEYSHNGQIWIAAYSPIPATGWALIVQQPRNDTLQHVKAEIDEFKYLLVMSLLIISVSLVIFFLHSISPLTRLLKSIRSEQPFKAASFPKNEIGTLAEEFNKYSEALEEKVAHRTEELRQVNTELKNEIAERKKVEVNLLERESTLQSILRAAPVGIGLVHNRVFSWISQQVLQLTGYQEEDLVGKNARIVYPNQEEFERVGRIKYGQLHQRMDVGEIDTVWQRKDGSLLDVHLRSSPINPDDLSQGVTFSVLDITERKKMEENLQRAHKLESLGILAGGIAHDFNNLLQSIIGNLSLAKMYADKEDKIYAKLSETEKAAIRATALTMQLLTFAKGGTPIKTTTDIAALIKNAASFSLQGSKVICEYFFPNDLWLVDVDEGQLSQVIQNLVINSSHAMPGGGKITIRVENILVGPGDVSSLMEGRYVQISLRDEGTGIMKEHLPKIFDPYFSTKQTGSGLGLAVAYSIIKNHSGLLTVESVPGQGATFRIILPASETNRPAVAEQREETVQAGKGRVLIMDDEESVLEIAVEMLEILGYETTTTRNGSEALEQYKTALETEPYDFVILDITVPGGMGGEETVRKLQELDPNVRAIVSSGYANDPIMAEFTLYGFCGVIPKPYSITHLSKTLNALKE